MPTVTPIAGSTFGRDKNGVRTIKQLYAVSLEGEEEPWDTLDTYAPSSNPFGLPLSDVRGSEKEPDGSWTLTLTWEGVPENAESKDDAELDYSSVENPIATLKGFDDLAKKYGAIFDGENFDGWKRKIKDPATGKVVSNPYYGQSHYLDGNVVLRCTFTEREHKSSYLENMQKIDNTPRVPDGAEALRETVDGQQWLKKKVTVKFRGNVWVYVMEWMMGFWAPHYLPRR